MTVVVNNHIVREAILCTLVDPDAQAYFDALVVAGFDSNTKAQALYAKNLCDVANDIDAFYLNNKANGDYSILSATAFYPMIGGTAATHAINGASPVSNIITWVGTVTHSATGSVGDGSTGFGRTGIIPSVSITIGDNHLSVYVQNNDNSTANGHEIGSINTNSQWHAMELRNSLNRSFFVAFSRTSAAGRVRIDSVTEARGYWFGTRQPGGNLEMFFRGISQGSQAGTTGTLPTLELYVLARNFMGTDDSWSVKECSFISSGLSATTTAQGRIENEVNALQTALGRNVY